MACELSIRRKKVNENENNERQQEILNLHTNKRIKFDSKLKHEAAMNSPAKQNDKTAKQGRDNFGQEQDCFELRCCECNSCLDIKKEETNIFRAKLMNLLL